MDGIIHQSSRAPERDMRDTQAVWWLTKPARLFHDDTEIEKEYRDTNASEVREKCKNIPILLGLVIIIFRFTRHVQNNGFATTSLEDLYRQHYIISIMLPLSGLSIMFRYISSNF